MTPDPLDRLSARLFDAARQEQPPKGGEQRMLSASLRELREAERARAGALRRGPMLGIAATAVLLAAALMFRITRPKPSEPISAEPAAAHSSRPNATMAAEPTASASAQPVPTTVPHIVKPQLAPPLPSVVPAATLSDELEALKVASNALNTDDAQAALNALDHYDHVLKGSKLRAEATLLRIQALARTGNAEAASTLAQRFVDQNPNSPLVDRARSFIQSTGLGGN